MSPKSAQRFWGSDDRYNPSYKCRHAPGMGMDRRKTQDDLIMNAALKACAALVVVHGALWCGPARADWRDDIGTFRIGIVAEPGAGNTVPGLALLTQSFTNALGMKVEFVVARDYAALIEAQANARIEYAIYSATAYATA